MTRDYFEFQRLRENKGSEKFYISRPTWQPEFYQREKFSEAAGNQIPISLLPVISKVIEGIVHDQTNS